MRKIPIDGPSGSGPSAGSMNNPTYSVTITNEEAQAARAQFDADKDAKRLYPKNSINPTSAASTGLEVLPSLLARKTSVSKTSVVNFSRPAVINPFDSVRPSVDTRPSVEYHEMNNQHRF